MESWFVADSLEKVQNALREVTLELSLGYLFEVQDVPTANQSDMT